MHVVACASAGIMCVQPGFFLCSCTPKYLVTQVRSEKRLKDIANFLALQVEELPPLQTAPSQPRVFETWLPSKLIKNYNWR